MVTKALAHMHPHPKSAVLGSTLTRWSHCLSRLALAATLTVLAACASVRGAQSAPFDERAFSQPSSPLSLSETELKELLNSTDEARRNTLLRQLLSDIDVRYLTFANSVVAGKSRFDFGKDLLVLTAGIASGLTASAGVKANYAALSTLVTGGAAAVDGNLLFNQTSLALVSTMDEQRALVLVDIRRSMSQSIEAYPGQTAFGDAIRYFRAGTLASAARELQKVAASRAATQEAVVRNISIPTDEQVARAIKRGQSFVSFVDDKKNATAVRNALMALKVEGINKDTPDDDVRAAAKDYYRTYGPSGEAEDLINALKKDGFVPN